MILLVILDLLIYFNSTMVQLIVLMVRSLRSSIFNFNSTMVQLIVLFMNLV